MVLKAATKPSKRLFFSPPLPNHTNGVSATLTFSPVCARNGLCVSPPSVSSTTVAHQVFESSTSCSTRARFNRPDRGLLPQFAQRKCENETSLLFSEAATTSISAHTTRRSFGLIQTVLMWRFIKRPDICRARHQRRGRADTFKCQLCP